LDAGELVSQGTFELSTFAAGLPDSGPPSCSGCAADGNSVWFTFTYGVAAVGTVATLDTLDSNYDTVLAVFQGSCAALTPLVCNDDTVVDRDRSSPSR
jgi:hypothetical protein